jgi:hypothetical protein
VDEDWSKHVQRVREDHYLHWLALISVAVWAGSAFGWITGFATFAGLFLAIRLTNTIVLSTTSSLRAVKLSRWGWLLVGVIIIVGSSAQVVRP